MVWLTAYTVVPGLQLGELITAVCATPIQVRL
jgi:hypothetical protein